MDSNFFPFPTHSSRLGFHYFQDSLHYRETDLAKWVPELTAMGASWLVLKSPVDRAIPEQFIRGIVEAGIEPLIDFDLSLAKPVSVSDLSLLFKAYSRWGAHGVLLFDRPNANQSWTKSTWARQDLVERFLDRFLPISASALEDGLIPILPPLEPGGSYWDTSFLKSMLSSLVRRNPTNLLEKLVISAYAFNNYHDLNWGAGGAQKWPSVRPYFTPSDQQDQMGFRIMDWYREIGLTVLERECPMILFGAGIPTDPIKGETNAYPPDEHQQINQDITSLLGPRQTTEPVEAPANLAPIPSSVIACNLWLLASEPDEFGSAQAWYGPVNDYSASIQALKDLNSQSCQQNTEKSKSSRDPDHPIDHYLLLPTFEWGVADWHLEVIRPFIKKFLPTVGFSLEEALLARNVTIIGNHQAFSDAQIEKLILSGCKIRRIVGDGTSIATQLAER
jgi:hypothetical protein